MHYVVEVVVRQDGSSLGEQPVKMSHLLSGNLHPACMCIARRRKGGGWGGHFPPPKRNSN